MRLRKSLRRAQLMALASLTLAALMPGQAAAEVGGSDRIDGSFADDKVLVRFEDSTSANEVASILDDNDLVRQDNLELADVAVYRITDGTRPERVIADLRRNHRVAIAEPDYDLQPAAISNDPNSGQLWGLDNTGQTVNGRSGVANVDVNAPAAWQTTQGENVIVAVLDEGIDIAHPEFAGRIWQNNDCFNDGIDHDGNGYVNDCNGWDFFNRDSSVYDPVDIDDHGTHVAGTIAANVNNSQGVAGVAPQAKIMPLKFLGPNGGSTSDAILAIQYAKAKGARIVNCSWSGTSYSQALRDAIANSGMTFVVAAGNDTVDLATTPHYPAAFDLPNMITVASVDNRGELSSFSNYGGSTDVGAPGSSILSTMPKPPASSVMVDNSPSTATWRTSFWGFGLEDVTGASTRREVLSRQLARLGATSNTPILLVDDDESVSGSTADTASYYSAALSAGGFTNITVRSVSRNASGPNAAEMSGKVVIWQTGYAFGSVDTFTLTTDDVSALNTHLNNGGRLLLAGADAIWRNEATSLVSTKLGVKRVDEGDPRTAATGVPGSALDSMTVSLSGLDSPTGTPNAYKDSISPVAASARNALMLDEVSDWNNSYGFKSGTSMATPHVAGVAALVAARLPGAGATEVANRVMSATRPLASLAGKTRLGGIVDAQLALSAIDSPAVTPPASTGTTSNSGSGRAGYRFVASDGGIFSYGGAEFYGSTGSSKLNQPVVGMATQPDGSGYWLVARDGGIFSFSAAFHGSAGALSLNQPIVGMAATPSGNGYWLVASDGGIFSYGDAKFFGSTGAMKLNKPIVGMAATPSGDGYWLVASDGGIFSYGDAKFFGSTGALGLNQPIVGLSSTPSGKGYWLVSSDGGIFNFGDATFRGSAGAVKLNKPVVGIESTPTGLGYWLVASDGGIFSYGDAAFFGSTGNLTLNQPIVSMAR